MTSIPMASEWECPVSRGERCPQVRKAATAKAARKLSCAPQLAISAASEAYDRIARTNASAAAHFRSQTLKAGRSEEDDDMPHEKVADSTFVTTRHESALRGRPRARAMAAYARVPCVP